MDATLPSDIQNMMDKVESKRNVLVKLYMVKVLVSTDGGLEDRGWGRGKDGGQGGGRVVRSQVTQAMEGRQSRKPTVHDRQPKSQCTGKKMFGCRHKETSTTPKKKNLDCKNKKGDKNM